MMSKTAQKPATREKAEEKKHHGKIICKNPTENLQIQTPQHHTNVHGQEETTRLSNSTTSLRNSRQNKLEREGGEHNRN